MKYCENCGEVRPDHLMFCTKCGTKLVERSEDAAAGESEAQAPKMQAEGGMITCPNCGRQVPDTKKFCTGCGSMLTGAAPAPVSTESVMQQRPEVSPQTPPANSQSGKKMEGKKLGLLIAAIVVGALVVMGGSFLLTELLVFHTTPAEFFANLKGGNDEDEELLPEMDEDDKNEEEPLEAEEAGQPEEKEEEKEPEAEETPTPEPTPEPTPTPFVWEERHFDMDKEQDEIDTWVKEHRQYKKNYKKHDYGDFVVYTQSDTPVIIWAKQGLYDWNYDREYHGGADYYVELNDGYQAVSKFYYEQSQLFRVIDDEGVHEYGCSDWEKYNEIGERLKEDRKKILEEFEQRQ